MKYLIIFKICILRGNWTFGFKSAIWQGFDDSYKNKNIPSLIHFTKPYGDNYKSDLWSHFIEDSRKHFFFNKKAQ